MTTRGKKKKSETHTYPKLIYNRYNQPLLPQHQAAWEAQLKRQAALEENRKDVQLNEVSANIH